MPRRFTQKKKGGYRGSLGGAPMRGAFTTGSQQELKQMGGVPSRATQRFLNKALKQQRNAATAKKAANNAIAAARKAENNAQRAIHAANEIRRAEREQKERNRAMVNNLVRRLGNKQRSIVPFVSEAEKEQNAHYQKMVTDLVGN